jgi:hypothetical protein
MNAAQFAEFWQIQGHKVIETKSCYWYNPQPLFFMSLPYHRLITPSRRELAHVLLSGPSVAVRFPTVPDGTGKEGGLFIGSDRNYDLSSLHQKARNQTRRGLENCTVEQVDFGYLAEHGHTLNEETFQRQGRDPQTITKQQWHRYCEAASQIPDFEAWGAFVNGHLAAFMVTALVEDCFSILHQSSSADYLGYYPNNALIFTVTKLKLSCPEVGYVSYGLKSLDDTGGLDHFKLRMGFELKPFKDCVVFNPVLKPFLTLGGRKIIGWMAHQRPESDLWRKASRALDIAKGKPNA